MALRQRPYEKPWRRKVPVSVSRRGACKKLRVMDATALALCMENDIPIIVFKLLEPGSLRKCVEGQPVGTIVKKGV